MCTIIFQYAEFDNLSGSSFRRCFILIKTVDKLKPGEKGIVESLGCSGAIRRRIIDMGITPGAVIVMRKTAPMGDPIEINVRGYELSIRKSEAQDIRIEVDG